MSVIASQITSLTIVYSTVYSSSDQRKYQSSTSLAFVWGIHQWPVNSPHKGPVMQKMFPYDDVIILAVYLQSVLMRSTVSYVPCCNELGIKMWIQCVQPPSLFRKQWIKHPLHDTWGTPMVLNTLMKGFIWLYITLSETKVLMINTALICNSFILVHFALWVVVRHWNTVFSRTSLISNQWDIHHVFFNLFILRHSHHFEPLFHSLWYQYSPHSFELIVVNLSQLISPWTKWPPFRQMIYSNAFSWIWFR